VTPGRPRSLRELCAGLPVLAWRGDPAVLVHDITYDSRAVRPGTLFVALRGASSDGHRFLDAAVAAGAAALLVEELPTVLPAGVTALQVADSRAILAQVAARFYEEPSHRLRLAGVTGTNGKSTFCFLLRTVLLAAGRPAGLIGTLGAWFGDQQRPTRNTTPESLDLQRLLAEMLGHGITDVLLEVSSHALAAHRVIGQRFAVRVFTNLTRDHLDLHGTEEAYFQAKRRLFADFGPGDRWVNLDCPWGRRLAAELPGCQGFSVRGDAAAALRVVRWQQGPAGLTAELVGPAGPFSLHSPLIGTFNLENLLAVCAAASSLGVGPAELVAGLATAEGAPGRLQRVADPRGELEVLVDYAHTPDALARVLDELAVRAAARGGRVITLFGCGGDRDHGKRPAMGAVAARQSALVVLTDDNPRHEPSDRILAQIEEGMPAGAARVVVPERREAIRRALDAAQPGDIVLLAGKGHEEYQERAGVRLPFSDVAEARQALDERSRP